MGVEKKSKMGEVADEALLVFLVLVLVDMREDWDIRYL